MTTYTVKRYEPSDWPYILTLLGNWTSKPLTGHAHWSARRLTALCLDRGTRALQSPRTVAWIVLSADAALGFTSFSTLPWDSEQIGLPAARLEYLVATGAYLEQYQVKQALLDAVLEHSVERSIKHLSVRLDASDLSGLHVLEQTGFITVDSILTLAFDIEDDLPLEPNVDIDIRLATPADSETVANLARQVYVCDRFHSDPVIPTERADELHAAWLRNSCTGKAADAVLLAEGRQGLLGFVTCKLQRDTKEHLGKLVGTIVLVATARHARGRGIAQATTLATLAWFREQGADIVEVGTQLRNIPASRLYNSCGFRPVGASVSLRKLL